MKFSEIKPGMEISGIIYSIIPKPLGIKIQISNSRFFGFCHISEISDHVIDGVEQLRKLYSAGDRVKAHVIKVDPQKFKVWLSLNPAHFGNHPPDSGIPENENFELEEDEMEDVNILGKIFSGTAISENDISEIKLGKRKPKEEKLSKNRKKRKFSENVDSVDKEKTTDEKSESSSDEKKPTTTRKQIPKIGISAEVTMDWGDEFHFSRTVPHPKEEEGDEEDQNGPLGPEEPLDDDGGYGVRGFKKNQKKTKKKKLLTPENSENVPKTADDFEKLLLSEGQESYVWIQYMAYWLERMMLEKARETAKRAIERINPSNTKGKQEIWQAYLNMEHSFGTSQSFEEVFKLALQYNDAKQIYLHTIQIYRKSNNDLMVREMFKELVKKFKTSKGVWLKLAIYLFRTDKAVESREILKRSLQSLPQKKHVSMITKFAQLEYLYGQPELARTLFENLISTYPKRIDIHTIYIDQERRLGNVEKIRSLYDRVTSLNLSTKKMKFLFKQFLQFEEKHGTEERVEYVKKKAVEYISTKE